MRRQYLCVLLLAVVVVLACGRTVVGAQAPATVADLVLINGKIVTVDERFTIAQAIAVKGERIVAVGTSQEISRLARPATRRIDLRGRTVIPGLIDNHMHLLRAATTWQFELRFDGVYTHKQAIDRIRARAAATRPVAARLPRVAPEQLEASSRVLVVDMNRVGLTTFGVAGCNEDVLEIFRTWRMQGQLGVRIFCIGGAAAGTPEQVDRSIPQIAQMKLYEGDDYIDQVVFGESVYTPLHDPMFAVKSSPPANQLEQWRRMAMEIAKAGLPLHVHANLTGTIDAFLDQVEAVNKVYPVRNLRWALAHVNQINASQLERMKTQRLLRVPRG